MYCKNCGEKIENERTKFCPNCGKPLSEEVEVKEKKSKSKKKNSAIKYILITFVVLIFIGMIAGILSTPTNNKTANSINNSTSTNNNQPEKRYLNLNESVTEKDWEFSIENVYFGQRINPPTQPAYYTYYQVKDTNNTYLCIILNAKNISNVGLSAEDVANVKVKYNNNYNYPSFSVSPDTNLGFTYSNITEIKALTSSKVYYLVEMPNSVSTETDTPIEIEITVNNNKYYYKYR